MARTAYLTCELKSRDLDSRLWLTAHLLKAGFDVARLSEDAHFAAALGGRYVFTGLASVPGTTGPVDALTALALGAPALYVQGFGNSATSGTYADVALFVQDDWRPIPRLTVRAGLRYQHQVWPEGTRFDVSAPGGTRLAFDFPRAPHDVAPRLALAWDVRGDGRTAVHAGWGLFHGSHNTGLGTITSVVGAEGGVRVSGVRFPGTSAVWNAPGRRLAAAPPGPTQTIVPAPELPSQRTQQASLGIDHALGADTSVSADLVWLHGTGFVGPIDYNPLVPALGPGRRPNDVDGRAGTSASVIQETAWGQSWYRGLAVSAVRRFGTTGELRLAYTLSKAEDTATDVAPFFVPQDQGRGRDPGDPAGLPVGFDPEGDRGPAVHDQRHRLVASGWWELPWRVQLSAIVRIASGRPYNARAGADLNGDGDGGGGTPTDRARTVPADPTTSVTRNLETMDAQATVDVRVAKSIALGRRGSLELMLECFNLLNHTNVTEVDDVFGRGAYPDAPLPTFGQPLQAGPPRQVQIGARVSF